jgi:hypothetical protein
LHAPKTLEQYLKKNSGPPGWLTLAAGYEKLREDASIGPAQQSNVKA